MFILLYFTDVQIIHCSAWINCGRNIQAEGCTFYDLFTQVVKHLSWYQFNMYDGNQQRYNEAIDSLQHLCSNIEPGLTQRFVTMHSACYHLHSVGVILLTSQRPTLIIF